MIKKISLLLIILLMSLMITSCTDEETYEKYNYVVLRINMPLNFDDLDNLFEIPLKEVLESDYIGEITGDGFSLNNEKVPCATDIEFEIRDSKMNDFKKLINNYKLPKDSYLKYNEKEEKLNGTLDGLELKINNLENLEELYQDIKMSLKDKFAYSSTYNYNGKIERIYLYTENIDGLVNDINNLLKNKMLENNVVLKEMNNYCDN